MKENIALLLAILYLIYRYKTYKKVNKTIEDRIEKMYTNYSLNGYSMLYSVLKKRQRKLV